MKTLPASSRFAPKHIHHSNLTEIMHLKTASLALSIGLLLASAPLLHAQSGGTVVAWGNDDYGQITVPAGLTGVTAIAAGHYHTVSLKWDGSVVA